MPNQFVRVSKLESIPDIVNNAINKTPAPKDKFMHLRNTEGERRAYIDKEERKASIENSKSKQFERSAQANQPVRYEQNSIFNRDENFDIRKSLSYNDSSSRGIQRASYGTDNEEYSMRPDSRYSYSNSNNRNNMSAWGTSPGHLFEDITEALETELLADTNRRNDEFDARNRRESKLAARKDWERHHMRRNPGRAKRLSDSRASEIVRVANEYSASDSDWMVYRDEILIAEEVDRREKRLAAKNSRNKLKRNHMDDHEYDYHRHQDWQNSAAQRLAGIDNNMSSDIFQEELLKRLSKR